MIESERPEEQFARRFFEDERLEVIRIPTTESRTADYFVNGDGPGYAVEVKSRNDEDLSPDRDTTCVSSERSYDVAIERAARRARKQLASVDPEHRRFWLLWLSLDATSGAHASFAGSLSLCMGTLYGIRKCLLADDGREVDCYYARAGVFERWTQIDAAIISDDLGVLMAANELSPRFGLLRDRQIARRFGSRFLVPTEREANGSVLIVDRHVDRRNYASLREALSTKYGVGIFQVVGFTPEWMKTGSGGPE